MEMYTFHVCFYFYIFYMNTCLVPHLEMNPKHFTVATLYMLFSASEQTHWVLVVSNFE